MDHSQDHRSELRGIALAAGAAVAFGTLGIFAKYAYRAGADPLPLLAVRFAIATALLAALQAVRKDKETATRPQITRLLLLGGFGYAFEATLFFAALENAPAGIVGLVFYSYPLWTSLLGLATRLEPYRPQLIVALILGSAGVMLVFSIPSTNVKGPLLALGAALAVAVYLIAIQVATRGVEAITSALWTSAGAALTTGVAALVSGQSFPLAALGPAVALGLASSIAFVALYGAIARLGSSRSAIATMLEPVTTVLLAALLLSEPLSWRIAAGAALVVSALPVLALTAGRREVNAPPLG